MHLVHELEVVGAQGAGHPQLGIRPVTAGLAFGGHRDPVRVCRPHLLARRMRVGARDYAHPERAAARDQRAERIASGQPRAAMVQRDLGRVVGDDAAALSVAASA